LGGFLPWTVFLPKVFASAFERHGSPMKRDSTKALLVIWSLFIFLFFSVSQSKLVGYILPVLPALALLCGNLLDENLDAPGMPQWMELGVAALIFIFVAGLCTLKFPEAQVFFTDPVAAALRAHGDALGVMLGIGVFILVGVWGMRKPAACL